MTTEYTNHFRLNKPDFRTSPWSSYVNDNADRLDALIYNSLQANGTSIYDNGVTVIVGQIMYDPDLNTFWVNTIAHTTEATGDFNDDRVANPGAWIVLHFAWTPRGQWAHSTIYNFYDVAYDPDVGLTAVCIEPHSSGATGTINDEIDKWVVIVDNSEITAALIAFDNTGTSLTATDIQAAIAELDNDLTTAIGNALQISENLDDLTDPDTALTNLGGSTTGKAVFKSANTATARTAVGAAASGANSDITSLTGLTTPLSVAQGGTGDSGTAWTITNPTATPSSGAFTTASCVFAYKTEGKKAFCRGRIVITTVGTATGTISVTLPISSKDTISFAGKESAVNGLAFGGVISGNNMQINKYDNTSSIAAGVTLTFQFVMELA